MRNRVRKLAKVIVGIVLAVAAVFGIEVRMALNGPDDHFQNPRYEVRHFGAAGKPLVYVVMGDSTAAGEGAPYENGIALETARRLASTHAVSMVNIAISGAKIEDVRRVQLSKAVALKPDIVLLAVGANDATHFTPSSNVRTGMSTILDGLIASNSNVRVILTGSPELGSSPRFAQPLRWFAGTQAARVNKVITDVGQEPHPRPPLAKGRGQDAWHGAVIFAPIARRTGPVFAADHTLYAPDGFHPNARGYATWFSTLDEAIDKAERGAPVDSSAGL